MVKYKHGEPVATNAMEAAAWHKSVRITCARGHVAVVNGDGLWWLCERQGWPMDFPSLRRHLYCAACWFLQARKVRPTRIEACRDTPTNLLPQPSESEARKAAKRFR